MNAQYYNDTVSAVDLAQFDDEYEHADAPSQEFDSVPDGTYQVSVEQVELTHSKNKGVPLLKWSLRILSGPHKNRMLFRNNVMVSRENIKWLKHDLIIAGLELPRLSELPAHLERLLDVRLEVNKRTRDNNENVYINKRLEAVSAPERQSQSHPVDDIPF